MISLGDLRNKALELLALAEYVCACKQQGIPVAKEIIQSVSGAAGKLKQSIERPILQLVNPIKDITPKEIYDKHLQEDEELLSIVSSLVRAGVF